MPPHFLLLTASLLSPLASHPSQADPLPAGVLARLGTLRFRAGEGVKALWIAPDGKTLRSESPNSLDAWDLTTGKQLQSLPLPINHGWFRVDVAISADGAVLALPGDPRYLHRVLRLPAGDLISEFGDPKEYYSSIACSPDGKRLAALNNQRVNEQQMLPVIESVSVWNIAAATRERSWKPAMPANRSGRSSSTIRWADAHTLLLVAPGKVKLFNADDGRLRYELDLDPKVSSIACSPDGALLATLVYHPWIPMAYLRLVDLATGKDKTLLPIAPVQSSNPPIPPQPVLQRLLFTPDGKKIIARDSYNALLIIELATGKILHHSILDDISTEFAVSPDGSTLALSQYSVIRLINLATGNDLFPDVGHQQPLIGAAFTPDGRLAVTASRRRIVIWDVASSRQLRRLDDLPDEIVGMKVSTDGRVLATLGLDANTKRTVLQSWNLATGRLLHKVAWPSPPQSIPDLAALSPNGLEAAVIEKSTWPVDGNFAFTFHLINTKTGDRSASFTDWGDAWQLPHTAFSSDGDQIHVSTTQQAFFHRWQLVRDQRAGLFKTSDRRFDLLPGKHEEHCNGDMEQMTLSPDGRYLLEIFPRGLWLLYDAATEVELKAAPGDFSGGSLTTFAPDGRTFARFASADKTLRIIERATFIERRRFSSWPQRINAMNFSPDGRSLIAAYHDSTALIWDLTASRAHPPGQTLTLADLAACWTDLAANDGPRIQEAIDRLVASPKQSVPFLRDQLHRIPVVDSTTITRLIADLDNDDFATREKAVASLAALEETGLSHFRQALAASPPAETRRRLQDLIDKAERLWRSPTPDRLRLLRALEVLELIATPDARRLLESLAKGDPSSWLTIEAAGSVERLRRRSP